MADLTWFPLILVPPSVFLHPPPACRPKSAPSIWLQLSLLMPSIALLSLEVYSSNEALRPFLTWP